MGQCACAVPAADSGDQVPRVPSDGKYHRCSGADSPRVLRTPAATSHIRTSPAGMANGDLFQRRRASSTASAATALATLASSGDVHCVASRSRSDPPPTVIRTPPTMSNQPVAPRNPPTTK